MKYYCCVKCDYYVCTGCHHENETTYLNVYPYNNWPVYKGAENDIVLEKAIVNNHHAEFVWGDLSLNISTQDKQNFPKEQEAIDKIKHNTCKTRIPTKAYISICNTNSSEFVKTHMSQGGANTTLLHKGIKNIFVKWNSAKKTLRTFSESI